MILAENIKISGLVGDDIAVSANGEKDNLEHTNKARGSEIQQTKDLEQTVALFSDLVKNKTKISLLKDKGDHVDNLVSIVENNEDISFIIDDIKTDENIEVNLSLES